MAQNNDRGHKYGSDAIDNIQHDNDECDNENKGESEDGRWHQLCANNTELFHRLVLHIFTKQEQLEIYIQ